MNKKVISEIQPGLIVLVTAGANGIGRVIAETFLNHGCQVHVCDVDAQAMNVFLQANPTASGTITDVSNAESVAQLFVGLEERYGRLDVLVNNAGIAGPTAPADEVETADWDKTIAVNLNGQFYCVRHAIPLLKKAGGGSIINLSSSACLFGFPNRAPYAASKWAVIGLTKTLAMELGEFDIRVNAISPGSVDGSRIDGVIRRDAEERGVDPDIIRDLYTRQTSLKRFVQPQEVAAMALFLASDMAKSISGQNLSVDGHTESLSNVIS
jgi:NAD(P)-dependent dehydrogenase (short-subunit alcohol dehydrogenase family)